MGNSPGNIVKLLNNIYEELVEIKQALKQQREISDIDVVEKTTPANKGYNNDSLRKK